MTDEEGEEIATRIDIGNGCDLVLERHPTDGCQQSSERRMHTYAFCDLVDLVVEKVAVSIEVLVLQQALSNDAIRHFALEIHHQFQHVVVRLARKHHPTGVQLVDGDGHGPEINGEIVLHAKN